MTAINSRIRNQIEKCKKFQKINWPMDKGTGIRVLALVFNAALSATKQVSNNSARGNSKHNTRNNSLKKNATS